MKKFLDSDRHPLIHGEFQIKRIDLYHLPFKGRAPVKGWKRKPLPVGERGVFNDVDGTDVLFVDSTGFGTKSEPALTLGEFRQRMEEGIGYAIVAESDYQVVVGAYELK